MVFQPESTIFLNYPKDKSDILKEQYFTISEICKIIDEAEWHFWNSHERKLSDDVWNEIIAWRLKGAGAEFAIEYFEMLSSVLHIPSESIAQISASQGQHLSVHKWK